LEPFQKNFTLTKKLVKIIKARDNFLTELKKIKNSITDQAQKDSKKEAIKNYKQKQSFKFSTNSKFSKISKKEFARVAKLLSLHTKNDIISRHISIRLNLKNYYSKLAELGFYNTSRNYPLSLPKLIYLNDYEIIQFYNSLIRGYLN
jgi:hypothetical protein